MPNPQKKQTAPNWPQIGPGSWRGEIVGSCSVNFGQVVQDGPPRQAVEFTYMIMPAALIMPEARFTWPGVIMIMTPTPMKKEFPDAGHLFKADHAPSLQLSLEVTRNQFRICSEWLMQGGSKTFISRSRKELMVAGQCTAGA